MESNHYCTAVLFDETQTFNRVWNPQTCELYKLSNQYASIKSSQIMKNVNLQNDLKVPTLSQLTKFFFFSLYFKLNHHTNPLIKHLSSYKIPENLKMLKRFWLGYFLT
jgi:hypothetical protein